MSLFDLFGERHVRRLARLTSRRGVLKELGGLLVGGAAIPLLPVARAAEPGAKAPQEAGDPASCDYWRYCAIDGYLCDCCGGSYKSCSPGTEMSPITWIGTCRNPVDGRSYVISYNDCCGKSSCGACLCSRDEGDRPSYRSDKTNDVNWCLGTQSAVYHCSTALVIGVAIPD
ncbi:MAG: methylamine dehydrogenase light chain [Panacagrimonas sp.]